MTTPPPGGEHDPAEGVPSESPDLTSEQLAAPTPAAEPSTRRRLHRSKRDSWLGGVGGGLADYFDIDPTLVRIAFVVLAIVSAGTAVVAYIAAWIIIPEGDDDATEATPQRRSRNDSGIVWGIILVLIGAVFLISQLDLDIDFPAWQVSASVGLILVGLLMVIQSGRGMNAGLLTAALILSVSLGFAQIADFNLEFDGAFGNTVANVNTVSELEDSYSHAFGSLTLDLRDLEVPAGETVRVDVSVVFGEAEVLLPEGVPARLDVNSVFGSVDGPNVEADGIAAGRDYTPPGWDEADRRLDVSLSTVFGSGRIR